MLHLSGGSYHILNWLALLLKTRTFDMSAVLDLQAREYVIQTFMPVLARKDYVIGYRADDSYFSFAKDFISGILSLRDLSEAMRLGALGEQVVLISPKAFEQIYFEGYETASYQEYHIKRMSKDNLARQEYQSRKRDLKTYYQWYSGYSFEQIHKALPFAELLNMYPTLHEADINKFVSVADEVLIESKRKSETNLSRLRKARGLSQKELAETSGVALRMIQLYEQKQNDINKAQASSLQSLAQALGCKIEDLFE